MTSLAVLAGVAVPLATAIPAVASDSPQNYRPYAYIANQGSNTVSVWNLGYSSDDPGFYTTIHVGEEPLGVAAAPVTRDHTGPDPYIYVTNAGSHSVSVINPDTDTVIKTIDNVGEEPYGVAVSPDGSRVWVTNRDSNTVSVIDASTNTVIKTIKVGESPEGVAVSPDGTRVYVINSGPNSNNISEIDTGTDTVIKTIDNVGRNPHQVAFSDFGTAYVTAKGEVSVIDTSNNGTVTDHIPIDGDPYGVVTNPWASRWVYVTNTTTDKVSAIDLNSNTVAANIPVGGPDAASFGIAENPYTNAYPGVWVTNSGLNNVTRISTDSNRVWDTLSDDHFDHPVGVAITYLTHTDATSNTSARRSSSEQRPPTSAQSEPLGAAPARAAGAAVPAGHHTR
ncbi:YncE family protein [Streptomyces sp. NPDC085932]|uniref:YncE family protein n=1 Tax=Streptomyces sp. NPDC085932 TaxID=3365741 RepID=UPI0037D202D9